MAKVAVLEQVKRRGRRSPGVPLAAADRGRNATAVRAFGWDVADSHGVIVNLTTWGYVQVLGDFVFFGQHLQVMRRRPHCAPSGS